jgi:acetyl-CoA carboxylase carboxyltransferase component
MDLAKKFMSYLPSHSGKMPPASNPKENPTRPANQILDFLPEQPNRTYDIRTIAKAIVDDAEILELKAGYARPCVTAFARLDGPT